MLRLRLSRCGPPLAFSHSQFDKPLGRGAREILYLGTVVTDGPALSCACAMLWLRCAGVVQCEDIERKAAAAGLGQDGRGI